MDVTLTAQSIPLDRAFKELQFAYFKSEIGQSQLELQTIKVKPSKQATKTEHFIKSN